MYFRDVKGYNSQTWNYYLFGNTLEFRFFEPPRKTKIGSKIEGKNVVFD